MRATAQTKAWAEGLPETARDRIRLIRISILRRGGTLLAELLEKVVDIVANVVGLGPSVGHMLVPGLTSVGAKARFEESPKEAFRVGGESINLIGEAPTGVRSALGGKHHPERKSESASGQCTPYANLYGAIS